MGGSRANHSPPAGTSSASRPTSNRSLLRRPAPCRSHHPPTPEDQPNRGGTELISDTPTVSEPSNTIRMSNNSEYCSTQEYRNPVTHIHTFQSALGCKGLTDEGQCLLFPSTLGGATLNWFY
ncbi:unnamed protein product [Prunus brigantina]